MTEKKNVFLQWHKRPQKRLSTVPYMYIFSAKGTGPRVSYDRIGSGNFIFFPLFDSDAESSREQRCAGHCAVCIVQVNVHAFAHTHSCQAVREMHFMRQHMYVCPSCLSVCLSVCRSVYIRHGIAAALVRAQQALHRCATSSCRCDNDRPWTLVSQGRADVGITDHNIGQHGKRL